MFRVVAAAALLAPAACRAAPVVADLHAYLHVVHGLEATYQLSCLEPVTACIVYQV